VVTHDGRDHYLGPYGSPESHEKYARLIARWTAKGPQPLDPPQPGGRAEFSVNELRAWNEISATT
jgi:hypothetical protein